MIIDAFRWTKAGTLVLSVTTSSQQATLAAGQCVELNNPSSNTATVYFEHSVDDNNPTANTTTSYPVYPGQCKIIRMPDGATKLAYIGSGSCTASLSTGEGV